MIEKKVAHRYAKALFLEAKSRKELEAVARDMQRISEAVSASVELLQFLRSQIISRDLKKKILHDLFDKDLSEIGRQFLQLILEKRREDHLPGITLSFAKLFKREQGLIDVEVIAMHRPDKPQIKQLTKALEKKTGSKISLSFTEDPSLKGGMAIRIDDTVVDGTIKHKLQQLETAFQHSEMHVS